MTEHNLEIPVMSFYVLEELLALAQLKMQPAQAGSLREFLRTDAGSNKELEEFSSRIRKKHLEPLIDSLALLFRDYAALAALGESFHSQDICPNLPRFEAVIQVDRDYLLKYRYSYARLFEPRRAMQLLSRSFLLGWSGGYGGERWSEICKAMLKYYEVPRRVYLDYMVDLTHNGGLYLNKPTGQFRVTSRVYLELLDIKRMGSLLKDAFFGVPVTPAVAKLVKEAEELGLVHVDSTLEAKEFPWPNPINWGGRDLGRYVMMNTSSGKFIISTACNDYIFGRSDEIVSVYELESTDYVPVELNQEILVTHKGAMTFPVTKHIIPSSDAADPDDDDSDKDDDSDEDEDSSEDEEDVFLGLSLVTESAATEKPNWTATPIIGTSGTEGAPLAA